MVEGGDDSWGVRLRTLPIQTRSNQFQTRQYLSHRSFPCFVRVHLSVFFLASNQVTLPTQTPPKKQVRKKILMGCIEKSASFATNGMTVPTDPGQTSETWTCILKQARETRDRFTERQDGNADAFLDLFRSRVSAWKDQLLECVKEFAQPRTDNQQLTDRQKEVILETRAALRFGLCCFSFESDEFRNKMQNYAVLDFQWHVPLVSLLSQRRGDSKCRLFAARLLSNLVTANSETAAELSSMLPISPSNEQVSTAILKEISQESEADQSMVVESSNWADMLISSARSGNREAVAAITAVLHNCIIALNSSAPTYNDLRFARQVASDSMLLGTLLRHFISVDTVKSSLSNRDSEKSEDDQWDSATEWIYMLLTKLSQLGMLPAMYTAILGRDASTPGERTSVLPEQNVLLHCMVKEAELYVVTHENDPSLPNPFGGEAGWETTTSTYDFLVELLRKLLLSSSPLNQNTVDGADVVLIRSGITSILDILAITLGVDSSLSKKLRVHLGTSTPLLQESAKIFGAMVDDLTERSVGKKTRELKMSDDEQKLITALVRLQGNMCFRCRHNVDKKSKHTAWRKSW
jgi:hypothetical protein